MKSNFKKSQRVSYTANQDEEEEDEDRMKRRDHKKEASRDSLFLCFAKFSKHFLFKQFSSLGRRKFIFKDFRFFSTFFLYLFIFIIIIVVFFFSFHVCNSQISFLVYASSSCPPCRSKIVALNSHCLLCISTRRTTVIIMMMMRGRK